MRAVDLVAHKRAGGRHEDVEIRWLIDGYLRDQIPDYQMAAWLMAVCWRGLDFAETTALTLALTNSGRRLDFRDFGRPVVDKHSTGGVGDKTSLVLVPMLAATGVAVAKMSGRGLGHTGGTIDNWSPFRVCALKPRRTSLSLACGATAWPSLPNRRSWRRGMAGCTRCATSPPRSNRSPSLPAR